MSHVIHVIVVAVVELLAGLFDIERKGKGRRELVCLFARLLCSCSHTRDHAFGVVCCDTPPRAIMSHRRLRQHISVKNKTKQK